MNTTEVLSFIENAKLASPPTDWLLDAAPVQPLEEDTAQAAVVDSNLVTYPEGTSLRVKNLVASWLLFAQRAASAQVPDESDTLAWMTAYHDVLTRTGWVQRGDTESWTEEKVYGSKVHEQILAVISVVLGPAPAALAIVTAALTSLQKMDEDSPWITLFDRRGREASAVGFEIANCQPTADGAAALQAIDFRVEARQTMTQVLFFTFTAREASIFRRGIVLELTSGAMESYGPAIESRVEKAVLDNIAAFDLAET